MHRPKFSIVIDNYNYGKFLRQCIESCLNQTCLPHEVIVVDDGSTDQSREILKEYETHPLVRVIYQENAGQEAALQRGFDQVTGDWVLGLDSDDYYFPDCLEQLASRTHDGISLIYFRAQVVDVEGHFTSIWPEAETALLEGNLAEEWLQKPSRFTFPPQSFGCFPISFIRSVRIFPNPLVNLRAGLTTDLYLRIEAVFYGQVAAIDGTLGAYRDHSEGDSKIFAETFEGLRKKLLAADSRLVLMEERLRQHSYAPAAVPYYHRFESYWQWRLLSCAVDHAGHPYPEEKKRALFLRAIPLLLENGGIIRWAVWAEILKLFLIAIFPQAGFVIYRKGPRGSFLHFIRRQKTA